jgi:glutaminase
MYAYDLITPGNFGCAVVSPPLTEAGDNVRFQKPIGDITSALGGNPDAPRR